MAATTTLARIKSLSPYEFWHPLTDMLGDDSPDDERVSIYSIASAVGLDFAEYCLRLPEFDAIRAKFETACAARVADIDPDIAARLPKTPPGEAPNITSFRSALSAADVGSPRFAEERAWQTGSFLKLTAGDKA